MFVYEICLLKVKFINKHYEAVENLMKKDLALYKMKLLIYKYFVNIPIHIQRNSQTEEVRYNKGKSPLR